MVSLSLGFVVDIQTQFHHSVQQQKSLSLSLNDNNFVDLFLNQNNHLVAGKLLGTTICDSRFELMKNKQLEPQCRKHCYDALVGGDDDDCDDCFASWQIRCILAMDDLS